MRGILSFVIALSLAGCGQMATNAVHPAAKPEFKISVAHHAKEHGFQALTYARGDGQVRDYFLHIARKSKGTLLYMHGNGTTAAHMLPELGFLKSHGLDVVVMEYTGYGTQKGRPSEGQMQKDVVGMMAVLRHRKPDLPILMVGSSLGGSLGIISAMQNDVDGLVTIGAFSRTSDLAPDWAAGIVSRRNAFDALGAATDISIPWTILHCDGDRLIPAEMAQALYQARRNNVGADGLTRMIARCDAHEVPYPLWSKAIKSVMKQRAFRK